METTKMLKTNHPEAVPMKKISPLKRNILLIITVCGVIFGVILGFSLRPLNLSPTAIILISYPGELFMRFLKMIILPLLISCLIYGTASLNAKSNGKIAIRTLIYFVSSSLLSAILGIIFVVTIHPGTYKENVNNSTTLPAMEKSQITLMDNLMDLGRNIFPDNLFQAAFQQVYTVEETRNNGGIEEKVKVQNYRNGTNTLGIVFFCILFGTLVGVIGDKGKVVMNFFQVTFEVIMKMVHGIMWMTPIGVSSIIAGRILEVKNLELIMVQLGMYVITVVVALLFYQIFIMQLIYFVFTRKNPLPFYCGLVNPIMTALATASSAATLPITFPAMNQLKVDSRITRFVLPIGVTTNTDGTAMFICIATIFLTQMSGISIGMGEIVTICLTATASSLAMGSVPSGSLLVVIMLSTAFEIPPENTTLLFAVDWLLDRLRTVNNMLSDCYASAVVEHFSRSELSAQGQEQESDKDDTINKELKNIEIT